MGEYPNSFSVPVSSDLTALALTSGQASGFTMPEQYVIARVCHAEPHAEDLRPFDHNLGTCSGNKALMESIL
jgi:hypothetical protein